MISLHIGLYFCSNLRDFESSLLKIINTKESTRNIQGKLSHKYKSYFISNNNFLRSLLNFKSIIRQEEFSYTLKINTRSNISALIQL